MKKVFAALGYALLFLLLGLAVAAPEVLHAPLKLAPRLEVLAFAATAALGLWVLALCFSLLPGARPNPHHRPDLTWVQGLWAMGGFLLVQAAAGMALTFAALAVALLHGQSAKDVEKSISFLACTVTLSETLCAAWLLHTVARLGPVALRDGTASGIAWCPAPRRAYVEATLATALILTVVIGLYHFFPPNMKDVADLPIAQLFGGPPVVVATIAFVAVLLGPTLEEFTFRGIGFAGLARSWGTGWAAGITSIAFIAAHAPEKIHYLPGFIDVGLAAAAACALRLRHHSLRPALLLHILYNGGGMLLAGLFS